MWERHGTDSNCSRFLEEGAFARVYLARQLAMAGRLVALKLTHRATRESQLLARLHHSAIVPVYSLHKQDDVHGLCMPYLGNTTLLDLLREILPAEKSATGSVEGADGVELLDILVHRQDRITTLVNDGPGEDTQVRRPRRDEVETPETPLANRSVSAESKPSVGRTASDSDRRNRISTAKELSKLNYVEAITWIGAQLADALDHAHRHGVLHCDIKPANVLLAPDGQARLLDFNVSLEQTVSSPDALVGGTLAYMAPEHLAAVQGECDPRIDQRSDIYSLGVVLFEMLAGAPPKRLATDAETSPRRLLRQANPSVTPALAAIIGKCLASQPEHRYETSEQLYDDLHAQCNRLPLVHQPEPSLVERGDKWVRRHPLLTSVSSITLLAAGLLLISLAAFMWRGRQLERLEHAHRGAQARQLLPEAIALASASRNYPDLGPEARAKSQAVVDLLRKDGAGWDFSLVDDTRELTTLVRLHQAYDPAARVAASQSLSDFSSPALSAAMAELDAALDDEAFEESAYRDLFDAYLDGRFSDVIELGETISQLPSNDYATWMWLGHSHLKTGDLSAAQECFSVCVTLRPNIEVAWFYRGVARLEAKRYAAATRDFNRAITIQPRFSSARYNLALALAALGETSSALDSLNEAISGGWRSVSGFALRSQLHAKLGHSRRGREGS